MPDQEQPLCTCPQYPVPHHPGWHTENRSTRVDHEQKEAHRG